MVGWMTAHPMPAQGQRRLGRPPRGARRPWRLLRRAGLGLLLLPVVLLAGIGGAVWWTLPASDMTLRLPGLSGRVTVTLDEHGIPRIAARTEADAAMALGWLHARDRLF